MPRYLSKTRFQMAMQCPTKLFYDGKLEYANQKIEDSFLLSLAEGGFQVGALSRCVIQGGHNLETSDFEEALHKTNELFKLKDVIIYEAAFLYQNMFVRVDIIKKEGNTVEVIEVKSKSFDPNTDRFLTKTGLILSNWREYLDDIAFQKHVVCSAFPECSVKAFLMFADKTSICPTDGLNQKFRIITDQWRKKAVKVSENLKREDLVPLILKKISVDEYCDIIFKTDIKFCDEKISYKDYLKKLAEKYEKDERINIFPSSSCKSCEFQATEADILEGYKSGLRECWKNCLGWKDEDFHDQTVLDIWNFRKKDEFIQNRCIKLDDIRLDDINPTSDGKPGISASQRQWMQIEKYQNRDSHYWIDKNSLLKEMSSWVYPLHFIDFETFMVAIPFNKGKHPYEDVAFQFSHHIVHQDGMIEHKGQYLNVQPGVFPNYEFVRALKRELDNDEGSIFRYASHENTFLNLIRVQLMEDQNDIPDRDEFCTFIKSITKSINSSQENWEGRRCMIDMCELVKRYYYAPETSGSNSIKYVLPAMINNSIYLKTRYAKPIYGSVDGIPSLNYKHWRWIEMDASGRVIDPYKLLPKMFLDVTNKDYDLLSNDDEIRNGGAALTAYAKMQFEDMSDYERAVLTSALLKYCELDTFAMVML